MTSSASSLPVDQAPAKFPIGTILIRFIVPLWVVAGALFKLSDLNPNVLPQPVKAAVFSMEDWVSMDRGAWLLFSMRSMVAVELVLVGIMFLVPKLARSAAIAILALFCVVLLFELGNEVQSSKFQREGFAALLKPCGCFGAWSPPTIVTFMIDALLLVGCLLFKQSSRALAVPSGGASLGALILSLILGPALAFGRPGKEMPVLPEPGATTPTLPNTDATAAQTPTEPTTTPPTPTQPAGKEATPAKSAWPAFPTKLSSNYFIAEKKSIGKELASLPIAPILSKSMPADFTTGRKTLIFYRDTCDHCFELMGKHFGGKLETPTYSIQIPDAAGGKTYPNACKECVKWELPAGPDYIIQSPLVMTIVDGTIAAICKDSDKPGALEATLNAWAPGHEKDAAVDGMLLAPMPATATSGSAGDGAKPVAPPPPASASKPWPAMPKLESVYAPDTATWKGKRLDELDLPLLISRPVPTDLNAGEVVLLFYRVDCEHCEAVILEHFAGDLGAPTLLISIPDAIGTPFDNPCNECLKATLPKGPTYVVETPILVVARDGVVQHVFAGQEAENVDEVNAALPKAKK